MIVLIWLDKIIKHDFDKLMHIKPNLTTNQPVVLIDFLHQGVVKQVHNVGFFRLFYCFFIRNYRAIINESRK